MNDMKWVVDVDATSFEVGLVEEVGLDNAVAVFDCKDVSEISETIQCRQEHLTFKYSEPESPI